MRTACRVFLGWVLVLAMSPLRAEEGGAAWLPGVAIRVAVTLENQGAAARDVPVRVPLDSTALVQSGLLRPDCTDITVADSDGVTSIPYVVDHGCGTTSTELVVFLPQVAQGERRSIYLYYGPRPRPPAAPLLARRAVQ